MNPVARTLPIAIATLALLPVVAADDLPDPDSAPAWIDASYDEGTDTLWLTWADVVDATAYNIYKGEILLATLSSPGYQDTLPGIEATVYRVAAVLDGTEGAPAAVTWAQGGALGNAAVMAAPGVGHQFVGVGFRGDPCALVNIPGGIDWECVWALLQIP